MRHALLKSHEIKFKSCHRTIIMVAKRVHWFHLVWYSMHNSLPALNPWCLGFWKILGVAHATSKCSTYFRPRIPIIGHFKNLFFFLHCLCWSVKVIRNFCKLTNLWNSRLVSFFQDLNLNSNYATTTFLRHSYYIC